MQAPAAPTAIRARVEAISWRWSGCSFFGANASPEPALRWPATARRAGPRACQRAQGAAARRTAFRPGPEAAQRRCSLELKRLQVETSITFVFVTHDQHEALTMSDRLAVMRDGPASCRSERQAESMSGRPVRFVADFIGEANLLEASRVGPRRFRLAGGTELETAEESRR